MKAKLQAELKRHEGPREAAFVKQFQPFGGEKGEDADGNKADPNKADPNKPPTTAPVKATGNRSARFDERECFRAVLGSDDLVPLRSEVVAKQVANRVTVIDDQYARHF